MERIYHKGRIMMKKYSMGIDFGTLSGRCVLVDLQSGEEVAVSTKGYTHGVMDTALADGTSLEPDWALQDPGDYLEVLSCTIPDVIQKSGIQAEQIVGVGIDFTACTMLPIKRDGTALCMMEKYRSIPHAYVKLWKHHAAQDEANELNRIAEERQEPFLKRYGGKISSEWMIPKIWQILNEAPHIYEEADYFIEACDWMIFCLCGKLARNSCSAGYKAIWNKKEGYPSKEFFAALDPRLADLIETKLNNPIIAIGDKAGEITEEAERLTGLKKGTAVAAANLDAHVSVVGMGITQPAKMFMIMGTSTCHMLMGEKEKTVPGICGLAEDGILPGYIGYEAGQSCVGDHFRWLVENCVPEEYFEQAEAKGQGIYEYLTEKAQRQEPGEHGLLALDWWNGNRSVLVDGSLSGLLIGATLNTKAEDIFRALIEATAYGTRKIIETYEQENIPIDELYAAGGIAKKNPFMMQVYADVTKRSIKVTNSPQIPALSAAIFGALAAGSKAGGFDRIEEAVAKMAKTADKVYVPNAENASIYDLLYCEYAKLHDYFGRGENDVMKRLKKLKAQQSV